MNDPKVAIDLAAAATAAGTILSWLPEIAAGLTIVWYLWRMLEKVRGKG